LSDRLPFQHHGKPECIYVSSEPSISRLRSDEFFISLLEGIAAGHGHVAVSADHAVAIAERELPDVVLMNIQMLGSRDGIDAAEEIVVALGSAAFS
jgi:CheY-like chemotaxis protein